jgi:hypothetical protein
VPKFIMFWPWGGQLVYILIIFPSFFHNVSTITWIITSFNCRYPLMHVHTSHWSYGYSFFMLCPW